LKAKSLILVAVLPAALTLAGCDQVKKLVGGKPKGQVVATVNGDEITTIELNRELAGFASKDPKVMKAAQQQALQQIIMRDLLTQKAKENKLDKTPEYTVQVRRGEETLLAQLYQRKLAAAVAAPTRDDAESFVASHPTMFAQHRIMVVDQLVARPNGKVKPDEFKPLKTLEEVKGMFDARGVPYRENVATVDTLTTDPRLIDQIDKLPAGEVFIVPQQGALMFNRIASTKALPIRGDIAVNYALGVLRNQKAQDLVRTQMIALRSGAEKSITYNPAYKPDKPFTPPPAPGMAPATPAAAPAAAAPPAAAAAPAADAKAPPAK
jgi:EpsD family peptidyl-prolyl cis-trans isomerase